MYGPKNSLSRAGRNIEWTYYRLETCWGSIGGKLEGEWLINDLDIRN